MVQQVSKLILFTYKLVSYYKQYLNYLQKIVVSYNESSIMYKLYSLPTTHQALIYSLQLISTLTYTHIHNFIPTTHYTQKTHMPVPYNCLHCNKIAMIIILQNCTQRDKYLPATTKSFIINHQMKLIIANKQAPYFETTRRSTIRGTVASNRLLNLPHTI